MVFEFSVVSPIFHLNKQKHVALGEEIPKFYEIRREMVLKTFGDHLTST